jgi:PhnB protein
MAASAAKPIREGFHTVTPYISVPQALELVDFVKQAFGATELLRGTGSGGGWHVELQLGDSVVMIGGGPSFQGPGFPTALWYFVKDVDAVYRRALELGATSLSEPVDQPYGIREAGVKDLAGNFWYISRHLGPSHLPEGFHTITPYLHPKAADPLLDFLQQAFGAEVLSRHDSPGGRVMHAQVRIGDSQLAMGEPAGVYQTMPTMFYVYVDDVDALYQRAIQAGGTTMFAPALQPYGDRVGALSDPFGNRWYIATHVKDVPR